MCVVTFIQPTERVQPNQDNRFSLMEAQDRPGTDGVRREDAETAPPTETPTHGWQDVPSDPAEGIIKGAAIAADLSPSMAIRFYQHLLAAPGWKDDEEAIRVSVAMTIERMRGVRGKAND